MNNPKAIIRKTANRNSNQLKFSLNSDEMSLMESKYFRAYLKDLGYKNISRTIGKSTTKPLSFTYFCMDNSTDLNAGFHTILVNRLIKNFRNNVKK